ncbi:hypothetical protein [Helicobacter cappadocius]|uniref:Septum formation initiator n=1 Tax=Helicobacter cappadocius TaxID=3063998 RepID=A0AA90ST51_9HELI|nr:MULTISPECIES: hypothetical protein [unclassified Helicobacter]MDO7253683.1 hypothetical protein [Helicobacter sp. faydin-H75]MDP2539629.1 hypothetical protein [Helicobacter sp. faydin-H76]
MIDYNTRNRYFKFVRMVYVNRAIIISFFVLMGFGAYMAYLLFGTNSIEVLIQVKNKRNSLEDNVHTLQYKNSKLQKQLFELKGLEP